MRVEMESKRYLGPEITALNPGDAFFDLAQGFNELISRRAYELFQLRGCVDGYDREDWQQALSEILMNVSVDIKESEGGLTVRADVPGFSDKEIEVRVSPRSVCITGVRQAASEQSDEKTVVAERRSNQVFRALELPAEVDPDSTTATLSDGVLEIKLMKVGQGKKVPITAKAATA